MADDNLENTDPEISELIRKEKQRQLESLDLIACQNFTSTAVMQAMGSCLTNKYSEGQIGNRYYGGNENIDKIEKICKKRALEAYNLNSTEWSVNVQALSGSQANFAVYTALLNPGDKIMGLAPTDGGNISYGLQTENE